MVDFEKHCNYFYILFPLTRIPVLLLKLACLLENLYQPLQAELVTSSLVFIYHFFKKHIFISILATVHYNYLCVLSLARDYKLHKF